LSTVTLFLEGLSLRAERGDRKHERKTVKLPGPDYPISIQLNPARVVVSVAGRVVADTRNASRSRKRRIRPFNTDTIHYQSGEGNPMANVDEETQHLF